MDRGSLSRQISSWDVYTDRASLYAQHRFDYASELVDRVVAHVGLRPDDAVADIGAGTGKLAQHFLDRAQTVFCVEPNTAMMAEAKARLGDHSAFVGVPGRAEATGLADESVSLVVAGMALDWFDPNQALKEFRRITRPPRWFAIFRYQIDKAFLQRLLRSLGEYRMPPEITKPGTNDPSTYLSPGFTTLKCDCSCEEPWEQFIGGTLSMASAPAAGSPEYDHFCSAHRRAFLELSVNGKVRFDYTCTATVGQLRRPPNGHENVADIKHT